MSRSEEKSGIGFVKLFEKNVVFPGFVVWVNQKIQEPLKVKLSFPFQTKKLNQI